MQPELPVDPPLLRATVVPEVEVVCAAEPLPDPEPENPPDEAVEKDVDVEGEVPLVPAVPVVPVPVEVEVAAAVKELEPPWTQMHCSAPEMFRHSRTLVLLHWGQ